MNAWVNELKGLPPQPEWQPWLQSLEGWPGASTHWCPGTWPDGSARRCPGLSPPQAKCTLHQTSPAGVSPPLAHPSGNGPSWRSRLYQRRGPWSTEGGRRQIRSAFSFPSTHPWPLLSLPPPWLISFASLPLYLSFFHLTFFSLAFYLCYCSLYSLFNYRLLCNCHKSRSRSTVILNWGQYSPPGDV